MADIQWGDVTQTTNYIVIASNLASGECVRSSILIDNTVNKHLYMCLQCVISSGSKPDGAHVDLYTVTRGVTEGMTDFYEWGYSGEAPMPHQIIDSVTCPASSGNFPFVIYNIKIPPLKFYLGLQNNLGVAISSGSYVSARFYNQAIQTS